jgi:phosphohistidine phosphatase SixA
MPPTELYLVRHAIAAERGKEWPDDTKRPLTKRGISLSFAKTASDSLGERRCGFRQARADW